MSTVKIKPVGSQLLIRIIKEQPVSNLIIPEHVQTTEKVKAVVEEVGTTCNLGIKVGHEVMFKHGVQGIEVGKDLHLIPEVGIAAILNWTE